MDEWMTRFWSDLVARTTTGPMTFRFVLQPLMAIFYAHRDGLHDARAGRPPYFYTMLTEPGQRIELLREGFKAVARVIAFGVVIDTIYQIIVFGRLYPGELVVIVLLLAFVPYLLFRGPINRLVRRRTHG
jgi:hypothetical protein